jgi:hypothetical protein
VLFEVANEICTIEGEEESDSAYFSAIYKGIYTKRQFKMKGKSIVSFIR